MSGLRRSASRPRIPRRWVGDFGLLDQEGTVVVAVVFPADVVPGVPVEFPVVSAASDLAFAEFWGAIQLEKNLPKILPNILVL